MAVSTTDELLAAIRRLPLDERLKLIEKATNEATEEMPKASSVPPLLGLMADDPKLVDEMCAIAYQARGSPRMRAVDE